MNKKGNVKYPVWGQTGKQRMRWRLVITDMEGKNRGKLVRRYREAKKIIKALKKKHPDFEYTIVSRQVGYGPPASRISDDYLLKMNVRGRLWCPYCRKFRVFDWDSYWVVDRCPICRVFVNNAHVNKNNPGLIT